MEGSATPQRFSVSIFSGSAEWPLRGGSEFRFKRAWRRFKVPGSKFNANPENPETFNC
jgi:hypothetical protein